MKYLELEQKRFTVVLKRNSFHILFEAKVHLTTFKFKFLNAVQLKASCVNKR